MNYIDYQSKQFVIDTLMKLADSSPVKKIYPNNIYGNVRNSYDISQHELDIWINYINSVLDILSAYINPAELSLTKMQIQRIASDEKLTFSARALTIERELLRLAQNVLRYYQ